MLAENDVLAVSVLSGNRNFEGRIHAQVRANYLASPPLVVAYALAGKFTVLEECRKGGWSRIWVTEPERLRATHHGWVANRFLTNIPASAI